MEKPTKISEPAKQTKQAKPKVDSLSSYICTVGTKGTILIMSIGIASLFIMVNVLGESKLHTSFALGCTILVTLLMLTYIIKHIRGTRKGTLKLERLTVVKRLLFIILIVIYSIALTIGLSLLVVYIKCKFGSA